MIISKENALETLKKRMLMDVGIHKQAIEKFAPAMKKDDEKSDKKMVLKENQLAISGPIVSDEVAEMYAALFGVENMTCPKSVKERLTEIEGDVELRIDSPGGDTWAGASIMAALAEHDGRITAMIEGIAASMATIIMLAGEEIKASEWATIMIHRSAGIAFGNGNEIVSYGKNMISWDAQCAEAYAEKCGKDKDEMYQMMQDETWFQAPEAVELGLIDGVVINKNKDNGKKSTKAEVKAEDVHEKTVSEYMALFGDQLV